MCGFLTIINPKTDYSPEALEKLAESFNHRGPDNTGIVTLDRAVFIHNRLSIIDTTEASNQPMMSADGRYVLVYNGEIYNFEELCKKYLNKNRQVRADSDTSVLLYLLIEQGKAIIPHLDGMFAFVFYDTRDRSVIAARDTFGEKPLFVNKKGDQVIFGSDLRTMRLCDKTTDLEINKSAIHSLLTSGYIEGPETIWPGIYTVDPGKLMLFDGNTWTECPFENDDSSDRLDALGSDEDILSTIKNDLVASVKSRMRSDVPVGLFLSGGIDSAVILGACKEAGITNITPVSLDFEEEGFGEYRLAKTTGQYCGFDVKRIVISRQMFFDNLNKFYSVMPQPTMDGFNTFFISKLASELGIKVWISGVGGDEVFAGYRSSEQLLPRTKLLQHMSKWKPICRAGLALTRDLTPLNRLFDSGMGPSSLQGSYRTLRGPYTMNLASRLVKSSPRTRVNKPMRSQNLNEFQVVQEIETSQFLKWQLLPDIDAFSMASSIEVRAPFLNKKLYDFVSVSSTKYSGQWRRKAMLKRAFSDLIAPDVVNAPKSGFSFPIDQWMREYASDEIQSVLFDNSFSQIWDDQELNLIWSRFKNGRLNWDVVWPIYTVNKWLTYHG